MLPLNVNLDNQTVPLMPMNIALEHLSPDTRKGLMNSLPRDKINEVVPMDLESFDFDVTSLNSELLQGDSDLFKLLANNDV